ncbi:MAG: polysaccharide biosynthesis C-terminal domain-containing protein [Blastocatellia bacterium]|nr:polysaccharide biosynthesis C-terminal domain-containing protein [Blastocatellia bacterium]
MPVAPVFQLLTPAALVSAINVAPNWLCVSLGRTGRQLRYAMVTAPVCVMAFVIGIRWGIEGVAVSFSVVFTILFWAFIWYATRDSPVRFREIENSYFCAFVPACLAGSMAWLARRWLIPDSGPFIALTLSGSVFCVLYLALALLSRSSRGLIWQGAAAFRDLACSKLLRRGREAV